MSGPVGCYCEEQSSTQGRLVCRSLCLIMDVKGEGIMGKLMILRHYYGLSALSQAESFVYSRNYEWDRTDNTK